MLWLYCWPGRSVHGKVRFSRKETSWTCRGGEGPGGGEGAGDRASPLGTKATCEGVLPVTCSSLRLCPGPWEILVPPRPGVGEGKGWHQEKGGNSPGPTTLTGRWLGASG